MKRAGQGKEPTLLMRAESGDAEAQNELGRQYASAGGDKRSREMAERWFRRAADQGFVRAKHNLGVLCLNDPNRKSEALRWFEEASAGGWLPSVYAVGLLMLEAEMKDGAMTIFESAAMKGHADSQDALSNLHFERGTEDGHAKARYWAELAALQGVVPAQARLGVIYQEGLGVERDPVLAAQWALRAAEAGHPGAQAIIGVAYHTGQGVDADLVESAHWLLRSIKGGNAMAGSYLPRVLREMDPTGTAEAKLRASRPRPQLH